MVGLLPGLQAAAQDGAATEVWALEGFSVPESAAFDDARGVLYVSNIAGDPMEKNGAGYLSRVSPDGEMLQAEWVTGLDAPKGLALDGSTLYVADIDRLVAIDLEAGEVSGVWHGEGAQFLNDVAVDGDGRVFVSDMAVSAIYMLDGDSFVRWLEGEALQHPNGLKVDGNRLIVAAWGRDLQPDFSTLVPRASHRRRSRNPGDHCARLWRAGRQSRRPGAGRRGQLAGHRLDRRRAPADPARRQLRATARSRAGQRRSRLFGAGAPRGDSDDAGRQDRRLPDRVSRSRAGR